MSAAVNLSKDSIQILSDLPISGNREQPSLNATQGRRHVPQWAAALSPDEQDPAAGLCKGYPLNM